MSVRQETETRRKRLSDEPELSDVAFLLRSELQSLGITALLVFGLSTQRLCEILSEAKLCTFGHQ